MSKRILLSVIFTLSALFGVLFLSQNGSVSLPVIKADQGEVYNFAVYTEDGDILYAQKTKEMRLPILNKTIIKTDNSKVYNPLGIVEKPPRESILDIYSKVLEAINKDNKVIIIYIDGLGYEIYKDAFGNGNIPYLASLSMGVKALTVYPPITDVTFASMVTGSTPKYTGIHSREKKPLLVPTIFDTATQKAKSSKVIEGNIRIITDEVYTILNIDDNKNGTIDDEIYRGAIKEIQSPPDILLIHFHSYDDFGHKYGPSSKEALGQLRVLDSYIEDIVKDYAGEVIITADHGMHNVGTKGEHGVFSPSDLFIPIITKNN